MRLEQVDLTNTLRLYHYQPFKAEYLADMLRTGEIFCSRGNRLNDPWDCKPAFKVPTEPEEVEAFLSWWKLNSPKDLHPQAEQLLTTRSSDGLKQFLEPFSRGITAAASKHKLYCLSSIPDSTLMWSYYADHHRGVCLEFDTRNDLFSSAFKVIYANEYPLWRPDQMQSQADVAIEMAITKAKAWCHEKEYRILRPLETDPANRNDRLSLPPRSLTSVIAGCEADYSVISAIVKAFAPGFPVKKAVRIPNHFQLTIEE